jgi:hypothetical protein
MEDRICLGPALPIAEVPQDFCFVFGDCMAHALQLPSHAVDLALLSSNSRFRFRCCCCCFLALLVTRPMPAGRAARGATYSDSVNDLLWPWKT